MASGTQNVENATPDPGEVGDVTRMFSGGAAHVRSQLTGEYISKQILTLSATSQVLTVPATATTALIQVHSGTVTDSTYINLGGTATTDDLVIRNAQDAISSTEIMVSGDLSTVELLGTANASTAVIWYFL